MFKDLIIKYQHSDISSLIIEYPHSDINSGEAEPAGFFYESGLSHILSARDHGIKIVLSAL
jgi:hypothetical protein